jgi:hypothetical protein
MSNRSTLIVPVTLVVIGAGWLLSVLEYVPQVDWVWTLGLAAAGVLTFVVGGWNKGTLVGGVFFVAASLLSLLRQTGRLDANVEVPLLVLLLGVLLLAARHPAVPGPDWSEPPRE